MASSCLALPRALPAVGSVGPSLRRRARPTVARVGGSRTGGGDRVARAARPRPREGSVSAGWEPPRRARGGVWLRAITRVPGPGDDETDPEGDADGGEVRRGRDGQPLADNQIQLPQRSKTRTAELSFTCDKCQHRTTRMVNPDAYKRGTMFVQCAGCEVWHKLVDNLGLMYEFPDLEKEPEEFPEEEA